MAAEGRVAPGNRSASRHSRAGKARGVADRSRTPPDEESEVDDGQFKKLVLGMLREMRRDTSSATRAAEAASQAARQALAATDETRTAVDNLGNKQDELAEKLEQLQARTAALEARPLGSAAPSESGFSVIDAGSGGTRGGPNPAPVGAWLPLTIIIGGFPRLAEGALKSRVEKMVEAVPSRLRGRVSHVYTNSVMDIKAFIKLKGGSDEETFEVVRSLRDNCPELAEGSVEGLWCSRAKTPQKVAEGGQAPRVLESVGVAFAPE